jgi:predicted ATP-grasp superfamily ATP-dependent carboligase
MHEGEARDERALGDGLTVLVTDADRGSALSVIRSLGRLGCRVIAVGADERSPGFRSRYACERWLYEDPMSDPSAFVDSMDRAVRQHNVDWLFPVTDAAIQPLARARATFAGRCELSIAGPAALVQVSDKGLTLQLAERLGIPGPRTRVVTTVTEAAAAARELSWPLVLKPTVSRRYDLDEGRIETGTVGYARDEGELRRRMAGLEGRHTVLLQEYVVGEGHGVELLAWRGRTLSAFQHRRLAEVPLTGGASAWRESVALDPVLLDHSMRLAEALEWSGLLMVEFKLGREPYLMEINGRVWGSLPLAVHCGVDFPALLARAWQEDGGAETGAGDAPTPRSAYSVGVRTYNLELMVVWILQVLRGRKRYAFLPWPGRREVVGPLLALLSPRQSSDSWSWSDWKPALAEWGKIGRKLVGKLGRAQGEDRLA